MSDDEQLRVVGWALKSYFTINIVNATVYTAHIFGAIISTFILLNRPSKTKWTHILLALIWIAVLASTLLWVIYLVDATQFLRLFLRNSDMADIFAEAQAFIETKRWIHVARQWPNTISFAVGDIIVTQRIWRLFPKQPFFRFLASCLLFIDIALYVSWDILCTVGIPNSYDVEAQMQSSTHPHLIAAWSASLFTNAVSTVLMAWKAWEHRQAIAEFRKPGESYPVQKVLAVIVETGLCFMSLQVLLISLSVLGWQESTAGGLVRRCLLHVIVMMAGSYPCFVVILVHRQTSIIDLQPRYPNSRQRSGPGSSNGTPGVLREISLNSDDIGGSSPYQRTKVLMDMDDSSTGRKV